jgi:PAS domain S-box-containing protein
MDRTLDEIRQNEGRLARIVAISADAIICIDKARQITLFNEGAERVFGYAASEVMGQRIELLLPERFRNAHAGHVASFAGGRPTSRHMADRQAVFALRKDGREFPADASISKIIVEGEAVYTVVLRDVSDRFQREQERRIESDRLRSAMDAGRIGGFELDQVSEQVRLLGHAGLILGVSEPVLALERWYALIDPQDAPRVAYSIRMVTQTGHKAEIEYRVRRTDGVLRWVRAVASRSPEDGPWPRLFGAVQDITEQKALQQLLEERVAERTAALKAEIERREQAQGTLVRVQRMEAYGQLTGGIAHDFNNLLTVIGGNLELLDDHVADARHKRVLKRAIDAVDMGARLTRRLLSFARRSKLEPQLLNLNDQVVGVIDLLRRSIGESIAISSDLAPDLGEVKADASEIENAILNLAINARDAMSAGGKLVIETSNVTIDDDFSQSGQIDRINPGRYVRLSVSDTGAGMSPEVLSRAFEPFFTTKEPGRGTGLGLASIYGFTRQSNGGATIYSEPGKGTTVNLYLPRVGGAPAAAHAAEAAKPQQSACGSTILVVEDNAEVREVTTARLEKLGYRVLSSESGPSAIAVIDSGVTVDLVFSDIMMAGGMSGYDLARWVAARKPEMKILLTSGFADRVAAHGESDADSLKILRKPYATAELAQAIREALG